MREGVFFLMGAGALGGSRRGNEKERKEGVYFILCPLPMEETIGGNHVIDSGGLGP